MTLLFRARTLGQMRNVQREAALGLRVGDWVDLGDSDGLWKRGLAVAIIGLDLRLCVEILRLEYSGVKQDLTLVILLVEAFCSFVQCERSDSWTK